MPTTEVARIKPIYSRHTVESYFNLPVAIEDLRKEIGADIDPSRWNPFVATIVPGANTVAVVAPRRGLGAVRLTGNIARTSDSSNLALDARRGPRGHGLHLSHEITLIKAGSFCTTARLNTTVRGPGAVLVSRRRIADWHLNEIYNLRTRIERTHNHRKAQAPFLQRRRPEVAPEVTSERILAFASSTTKDPST